MVLIAGMLNVISAKAETSPTDGANASALTPQVQIVTPSYPVGIRAKETKLIAYSLTETGNLSGEFTSRSLQFYTQYGVPLSEPMGPYPTNIQVNPLASTDWNELIYLSESVVNKARSMNEYALVLKTTFSGSSETGTTFSAESSLLLLLPPDSFGKISPADGSIVSLDNLSLKWKSSVGAIDYEYCFDTIDNNKCDTDWTGTYWLSTYDTFAELQGLPTTTFYWQVRAANLSGRAYADTGTWWTFHTCNDLNRKLITVMNVNDSGPGSLRQAINDVCPGGVVTFVPQLSGQTIYLSDFIQLSKSLTIDGSNLDQNIKLDGASSLGALMGTNSAANPHVNLKGLDFLNATQVALFHSGGFLDVNDCFFSGSGTGIQNATQALITHSDFSNNSGGIINFGILQVKDSSFSNNNSGIGNEKVLLPYPPFSTPGEVTVVNSDFTQNRLGGIKNQNGTLTVTSSRFSGNQADEYGGGIQNFGTATVSFSQFINNSALQTGGGIINAGNLIIDKNTFSGNSATMGGGVFNTGGMISTDNTFVNNTATNLGGAISTVGIDLFMDNNTIYNNSAIQGGGVYFDNEPYGTSVLRNNTLSGNSGWNLYINNGNLELFNNILANSKSGSDCFAGAATILAGDNNLIENDANSPYSCGIASVTSDPLLQPLAENGGATQTMALIAGSPAIDAGEDEHCLMADQRGEIRPQGKHCDIGAYEYVEIIPKHPVMKSQALTPSSFTTQFGITSGSPSSLSLLDQSEADDDPAAYVSFQTPEGIYLGEHSFFLPEDAQTRLISTMLLQVNFKGPASSTQVWTWSIYDPNSGMWIKVGDSIGAEAEQWQSLIFRIRQPWRFVSPGNEIRVQLKSNNANGDAKIDYQALHVTYLSIPVAATPVRPPITPRRPGTFSE
jgi:predicted outer membrane repeat protein